MPNNKLFDFPKLETVEIDLTKKIFRINGKDFGHECTRFDIYCNPSTITAAIQIDAKVTLASYETRTGEQKEINTKTEKE